jgi:TolA-binding protein
MKNSKIVLISLIGLLAISILTGCGKKSDLAVRYEMEKKLNDADRLKTQVDIKGPNLSDDDFKSLVQAYQAVVDMVKLPTSAEQAAKASDEEKQAWQLALLGYTRIGLLYYDYKKDYNTTFDYFKKITDSPAAKPIQRGAAFNYMAVCRENDDQYKEAAAWYDSLAASYPQYIIPQNPNIDALNAPIKAAEMWQRLGNQQKYHAKLDDARAYYNRILKKYPGTPFEAAVLGKIVGSYLREDKFQQAVRILENTRSDSTGLLTPHVMMILADIYMNNLKDFPKAEKTYRQYIKNYPKEKEIGPMTMGLGLSLYEQGKYKSAREAIKNVEKLPNVRNNTVAEAYYLTALCYENENTWEKAIGQFDLVQATFPGTEKAFDAGLHVAEHYKSKGQTKLANQKYQETVDYIKKYANTETSNPATAAFAMGYLAKCYIEMHSLDNAIATLEQLHDKYPSSREGRLAPLKLADIYENTVKNKKKAAQWLQTFLDANPEAGQREAIQAHIKELSR